MANLTDDQKVLRNSTGLLIRTALLTIAEKLAAPLGLNITGAQPGQVPVIQTVDANGTPTSYAPGSGGGGTPNALPLAGGTMSGNINMDGNRVQNLPTPSANGDAVPKSYADNADALSAKADEIGIVITGARPAMAVTAGQYVIVRNSTISGIADGLYTAVNALSPSTDVSAADLTAVSIGGLNYLNNSLSVKKLQNGFLNVGGLIIQRVSQACVHNTNTSFTFTITFPNECLAVIPMCSQFGFGAPDVITVGNVTTSGCTINQNNTAQADMGVEIVAIGY